MELSTHMENRSKHPLPQFKHPLKILYNGADKSGTEYFSVGIGVPDKSIFEDHKDNHKEKSDGAVQCFFLFGYEFEIEDWHALLKKYPEFYFTVKLYKGKKITEVFCSLNPEPTFARSRKIINEPRQSLMKSIELTKEPSSSMYTVEISRDKETQPCKIVYYLPSTISKESQLPPALECLQHRYFNNKMLQILNEYISLDSKTAICYKDIAHHEFESLVYTGKVSCFRTFVKIYDWNTQPFAEVIDSFVEKLSEISVTDKHLLDEVEPLDFVDLKKQIRELYLEEKRIRSSLTIEKMEIVDEIEKVLEFLDLKSAYPQKLTYHSITPEMLKRIKSQNIDDKAQWIKEQKVILENLDSRLASLEAMKAKLKQELLDQEKQNNEEIQSIRREIKELETGIRYEEADRASRGVTLNPPKPLTTQSKCPELSEKRRELDELEKNKIFRYEMIKAEFEMEKEFIRRKAEYARAAEEIFNYIIDC